jgi:hypothetical protein
MPNNFQSELPELHYTGLLPKKVLTDNILSWKKTKGAGNTILDKTLVCGGQYACK